MLPTELFANRYRVLRIIGSGGMGEIRLVEDTHRANRIMALKTMRAGADEAAAEAFRDEFRSIRGVRHPNIPEVFDFGTLPPPDNELYFTCEYVEGQPLDQLAADWTPAQLQVVLVSLCRALAFLHSRHIVHRDIKPQNILGRLNDSGALQDVKLADFGLAARAGTASTAAGTIDYMAPELIRGAAATPATDIYALGMMLYRLAAGRMPYEGEDPLAVTRQRCAAEAPPPLRFRPELPVGLSDVIGEMIHLKPEERPASARHVIALLNEREGCDFPYETPESRAAYVRWSDSIVHGDAHDNLNRWKREFVSGRLPLTVLVVGGKGLGREGLVEDFAAELNVEGVPVQIVRDLPESPEVKQHTVVVVPQADGLPAGRLAAAVNAARAHRCWCVLSASSGNPELTDPLDGFLVLPLRPLQPDHIVRLLNTAFPQNTFTPQFAEDIYARSLGLPVAVRDLLNHLLACESLRIGLSGWELQPGAWSVPLHPCVREVIEDTLARQPEATRGLIIALSCSLVPLSAAFCDEFARQQPAGRCDVPGAIAALDEMGWLARTPDGFHLRFSPVSEHMLSRLPDGERNAMHALLARVWSAERMSHHPQQDRESLFHDFHAGLWGTPAPQASQVLRTALADGELTWVRTLVEAALSHHPNPPISSILLDALVSVEYVEGNLQAAADTLARLVDFGNTEVTPDNLEWMARYGMLEEKLGRTEHAVDVLQRCLDHLPEGHDSRAGTVFGTLAFITFKRGEADKARRLAEEGLVRVPPHSADVGQALLLNTVATLAFYRGDMDAAAMYWKRCLEVNEALHDRKGMANTYNNLGVLAAQTGDRLRARALWERCAQIAGEIHDVHRLAGIFNNLGVDCLETGALPEAEEHYLKALAIFRRIKSPREQIEILSNLGELCFYRADFPRAHSYLQEAIDLAASLEDAEGEIEPLVYMGKLLITLEEFEGASGVLERARSSAHEVGAKKGEGQAWEALAILRAQEGQLPDAHEALKNAYALLSQELDPLALLNLHLTECSIAAEAGDRDRVKAALTQARKAADIKWDPYAAARTLVYGLLFAQDDIDARERPRIVRQLSVYPDFLWRFYWASARRLTTEGAVRKALDEYGRGVTVLKAIASRLSEGRRDRYLNSSHVRRFKAEALAVRNSFKTG